MEYEDTVDGLPHPFFLEQSYSAFPGVVQTFNGLVYPKSNTSLSCETGAYGSTYGFRVTNTGSFTLPPFKGEWEVITTGVLHIGSDTFNFDGGYAGFLFRELLPGESGLVSIFRPGIQTSGSNTIASIQNVNTIQITCGYTVCSPCQNNGTRWPTVEPWCDCSCPSSFTGSLCDVSCAIDYCISYLSCTCLQCAAGYYPSVDGLSCIVVSSSAHGLGAAVSSSAHGLESSSHAQSIFEAFSHVNAVGFGLVICLTRTVSNLCDL